MKTKVLIMLFAVMMLGVNVSAQMSHLARGGAKLVLKRGSLSAMAKAGIITAPDIYQIASHLGSGATVEIRNRKAYLEGSTEPIGEISVENFKKLEAQLRKTAVLEKASKNNSALRELRERNPESGKFMAKITDDLSFLELKNRSNMTNELAAYEKKGALAYSLFYEKDLEKLESASEQLAMSYDELTNHGDGAYLWFQNFGKFYNTYRQSYALLQTGVYDKGLVLEMLRGAKYTSFTTAALDAFLYNNGLIEHDLFPLWLMEKTSVIVAPKPGDSNLIAEYMSLSREYGRVIGTIALNSVAKKSVLEDGYISVPLDFIKGKTKFVSGATYIEVAEVSIADYKKMYDAAQKREKEILDRMANIEKELMLDDHLNAFPQPKSSDFPRGFLN
ncbi:hypothetical protein Dip518_000405 [Parelusimicrobium proximum]|uniref:hypothetical protein n=1 Tax=Parelusimicrobium proximum TaxID=3228953 RepID=UPI003D184091